MPTFHDPIADAAEASQALRGLAHASRTFERPAEMYGVIGDLSSGIRSLRQSLEQLADVHERKAAYAFDDDGNHDVGVRDALAAAEELRQCVLLVDRADDRLSAGFIAAGRIAWHPEPAPEAVAEQAVARRWISVVFLQGDEADEVLDLIDAQGIDAAFKHLAGYDYGDETVEAAIANGHVYDKPQAGAADRTATQDVYTLTYSSLLGHVGLYRKATALPDPALLGIDTPLTVGPATEATPATESAPARRSAGPAGRDWFAGPAAGEATSRRGLSL